MSERTIYIYTEKVNGLLFKSRKEDSYGEQDKKQHLPPGHDRRDGFALPAGLVEERITVHRRTVPCCLYELKVSDETYLLLRQRLRSMYAQREEYHYSVLGAFACYFNLSLQRRHHYFCSQFVAGLLEDCGATLARWRSTR